MPGFRRTKAHGQAPHSQHRVQASGRTEFLAGETLHGLAKRYDLSRTLVRVWVQKFEAGVLDEDAAQPTLSDSTRRG